MGNTFGGAMLRELHGARLDAAVELLREGTSVGYREIAVRLADDGAAEVSIDAGAPASAMDEGRARSDLAAAEARLGELLAAAPAVRDALAGRPRRLQVIDDYGTSAALVCQRDAAGFRWGPGFPRGGAMRS